MTAAQGFQAQLGIDTANPVTLGFNFKSNTLGVDEDLIDGNGLIGSRERDVERVRTGPRRIQGQLVVQPTAVELARLLPWALGTAASGNTYALAETIPTRYVTVDKVGKVPTYNGVGVDKLTIKGQKGECVTFTFDLVGIDETPGNAASFPSLTLDTTTGPFVFTDLVLTIGGVTYPAEDFELSIDNKINKDRFFNSLTLTAITAQDRMITFRTKLPYGDAIAAYNSGSAGVAVVATFTNGGTSLVLSMSKVCFPRKPVAIEGRTEIMLPIEGNAYRTGATASLVTTLDSSP